MNQVYSSICCSKHNILTSHFSSPRKSTTKQNKKKKTFFKKKKKKNRKKTKLSTEFVYFSSICLLLGTPSSLMISNDTKERGIPQQQLCSANCIALKFMIALTCTSLADICSLLQLPQYLAYSLEKSEETKNELSLLYLSWSCPILTFHSSKVHTSLWVMNYIPPYNPFPHRQKNCQPLTILSLFPSKIFWQATFLSSTSSGLHS